MAEKELGQKEIIIFRMNFVFSMNNIHYNGENFVNKHHQMQLNYYEP